MRTQQMVPPDTERDAGRADTSTAATRIFDPDVQLMLRVQSGDDAAFAELVSSYQDRLISVFTHLLQSQDSAEDLAQEVFLRVYRARHSYEPTARFSTWLFRIANNLALNSRRSRRRRKETTVAPVLSPSGGHAVRVEENLPEKSALMPTRQADRAEIRHVVQDALGSLSERQRMAVLLNKFEGMSYIDISETLGMTPAAVKSLLARARETLRSLLEPYMKLSDG